MAKISADEYFLCVGYSIAKLKQNPQKTAVPVKYTIKDISITEKRDVNICKLTFFLVMSSDSNMLIILRADSLNGASIRTFGLVKP